LKRIREASIEQLASVEGVGPAVAEKLHAYLHAKRGIEPEDEVREVSLEDAFKEGNPAQPSPVPSA
jgi:excinuclease ABC subunit C